MISADSFVPFSSLTALKATIHIIFLVLFFPLPAIAQPYYIKGQVKDQDGTPIPNVTLLLHSKGHLYYTAKDGSFGMYAPSKVDTLTIFREGYEKEKRLIRSTAFNEVVLKKALVIKSAPHQSLASFIQNLHRDEMQLLVAGNETYNSIVENDFVNAAANPATRLTLNVDRASYSNIRRFLTTHTLVPPDAVRIEEMLNYFNLSYKEPAEGKTFEINTTLTACPWNKSSQLLYAQINSKKLKLDHVPQTHLVFLIDVSGSMDLPNRLPLLKSGFKALINNLRPVDSVSIVVYGGTVGVALFPAGGDEKEKIFKAIDSLQPGGATPGESGIKLAYSLARAHFIPNGNNRVILATDGDFNVGLKKEEELDELISKQQKEGIYLTCLGVGMGNYKDSKIQMLAQRGNGNFAYIDHFSEMEKVLLKEFMQTLYIVADDAYLTVAFNPEQVKEYRLIGFDNRVGAIRDTAALLEGGEVGSAYSLLVVFEMIPTDENKDQLRKPAQFTLRYKNTASPALCEMTEQPPLHFIPFKQLPQAYQFASAVVLFGSLLRQSKFTKNVSWNDVITMAKTSADPANYSQAEFLHLLELAKKLYGKKRKKEE